MKQSEIVTLLNDLLDNLGRESSANLCVYEKDKNIEDFKSRAEWHQGRAHGLQSAYNKVDKIIEEIDGSKFPKS